MQIPLKALNIVHPTCFGTVFLMGEDGEGQEGWNKNVHLDRNDERCRKNHWSTHANEKFLEAVGIAKTSNELFVRVSIPGPWWNDARSQIMAVHVHKTEARTSKSLLSSNANLEAQP